MTFSLAIKKKNFMVLMVEDQFSIDGKPVKLEDRYKKYMEFGQFIIIVAGDYITIHKLVFDAEEEIRNSTTVNEGLGKIKDKIGAYISENKNMKEKYVTFQLFIAGLDDKRKNCIIHYYRKFGIDATSSRFSDEHKEEKLKDNVRFIGSYDEYIKKQIKLIKAKSSDEAIEEFKPLMKHMSEKFKNTCGKNIDCFVFSSGRWSKQQINLN